MNERNVVELINKLNELGFLGDGLLHTVNGREYVTPEHLRKEIIESVEQAGGRLSLVREFISCFGERRCMGDANVPGYMHLANGIACAPPRTHFPLDVSWYDTHHLSLLPIMVLYLQVDLPAALGMDMIHCERHATLAIEQSKGALQLIRGELIMVSYFDNLAAEVQETLQVSHQTGRGRATPLSTFSSHYLMATMSSSSPAVTQQLL